MRPRTIDNAINDIGIVDTKKKKIPVEFIALKYITSEFEVIDFNAMVFKTRY